MQVNIANLTAHSWDDKEHKYKIAESLTPTGEQELDELDEYRSHADW
jgi:hypothetical protein